MFLPKRAPQKDDSKMVKIWSIAPGARRLIISAALFVATIGSAQSTPMRTIAHQLPDVVDLTHGGHSVCYAGHRHDWEARKIPCRWDEYIFHDGPLPLRREKRRSRRHR